MMNEISPLMTDPFVYYMETKVPRMTLANFLKDTDLDSDVEEEMTIDQLAAQHRNAVKRPHWRLHDFFGLVYSVHSSSDFYFAHDEKLFDGMLDERYVRKKSSRSLHQESDLGLDRGNDLMSRKQLMQKMLADNSVVAFSVKGNSKYNPTNQIAVDYLLTFNGHMRIALLIEGEGPYAAEISNYSCRRLIVLFEERFKSEKNKQDLGIIMRHAMEDLHEDLIKDDPSRSFDAVLSGVAGSLFLVVLFTILKENENSGLSFYIATVGPLSCYLIDKRQSMNGGFSSVFTLANPVVMTQQVSERERILEAGGDVREDCDWRVFGIGYLLTHQT